MIRMSGKRQKQLYSKEVRKAYAYTKTGLLCPPIGGYKSEAHKEQLHRDYALKLAARNFILAIC